MYDCWKNNIRWTTNQHWRNYANIFSFKSLMNASRNPFSTAYWKKTSIIIRIFIVNDNILMQLIFKMELYSVHIHFAPLEILSARPLLVGIDKLIRFFFFKHRKGRDFLLLSSLSNVELIRKSCAINFVRPTSRLPHKIFVYFTFYLS